MKSACLLLLLLAIVGASACRDTTVIYPYPLTPTGPTATTAPRPIADLIEFRVLGNANTARVRHTSSIDGLTQVTTSLPYLAHFTSTESAVFLSLEATPTAYGSITTYSVMGPPILIVQIFVNGMLFRETSSSDFLLSTVSVSGTWRRVN
jgi:hypothetical protein